ncbi:MAG: hypothetical protein VXW32_02855 [Myxococcota bacterium]|nr:hypothetical protein [Myxococcota bacterium]
MRVLALIGLTATAIGCTKDSDSGPQETGLTQLTVDGRLYRIGSTIQENGCGSWGPSFNDAVDQFELRITFPSTTRAKLHWENPQVCPKSETEVVCETPEALVLYDYAPDSDAVITYEDRLTLNWYEPDRATGLWEIHLDCLGTQCEIIGELNEIAYPCSILMDWILEPAGENPNDR